MILLRVLSSWQAIERIHAVHAMTARHQVAADLWTKPIDLSHRHTYRQPLNQFHHQQFIIITHPES